MWTEISLYSRIFIYTFTNFSIRSHIFLSGHIFRFAVTTLFSVTKRASDKMSEAFLFVR